MCGQHSKQRNKGVSLHVTSEHFIGRHDIIIVDIAQDSLIALLVMLCYKAWSSLSVAQHHNTIDSRKGPGQAFPFCVRKKRSAKDKDIMTGSRSEAHLHYHGIC